MRGPATTSKKAEEQEVRPRQAGLAEIETTQKEHIEEKTVFRKTEIQSVCSSNG